MGGRAGAGGVRVPSRHTHSVIHKNGETRRAWLWRESKQKTPSKHASCLSRCAIGISRSRHYEKSTMNLDPQLLALAVATAVTALQSNVVGGLLLLAILGCVLLILRRK